MEDNVIPINARAVRPAVDKKRLKYDGTDKRHCLHRAVEIDSNAREVTCQACSALLDPIKVITDIAYNEISLRYTEDEYQKLKEKIFDLKKEEKRVKARIRTASKQKYT